jgi:hypothetical protein
VLAIAVDCWASKAAAMVVAGCFTIPTTFLLLRRGFRA